MSGGKVWGYHTLLISWFINLLSWFTKQPQSCCDTGFPILSFKLINSVNYNLSSTIILSKSLLMFFPIFYPVLFLIKHSRFQIMWSPTQNHILGFCCKALHIILICWSNYLKIDLSCRHREACHLQNYRYLFLFYG